MTDQQTPRDAVAEILTRVADEGLPMPRDLDVALDAIFETILPLNTHVRDDQIDAGCMSDARAIEASRIRAAACAVGSDVDDPTTQLGALLQQVLSGARDYNDRILCAARALAWERSRVAASS